MTDLRICRKGLHSYDSSRKSCPVCKAEAVRLWKNKNSAQEAENKRRWKTNNTKCESEKTRQWKLDNAQRERENNRRWYRQNKESELEKNRRYRAHRRAHDPVYKLTLRARKLVKKAFSQAGWDKNSKTQEILGCDFRILQAHLIATAKRNYGGKYFPKRKYEIDHIVPLSTAKTEEDVVRLNHHTNLQFLLKQHNRAKGNKIDWEVPMFNLPV
jgi:hypothetical protein